MKKALFLSIVFIAGLLGGATAYLWHQATRLPTEYTASDPALTEAGTPSNTLADKVVRQPGTGTLSLTLSEQEVNQVVVGAIAQDPQTAKLLQATKGINTSLQNNQIESGLVVNLSQLPAEALPPQGQAAVNQLTERFPILANRDIYVGIKGTPQVREGRLVLDDSTVVTIGRFQLPLAELASQVGLSKEEIEAHLSRALEQNGITLQDVQIDQGQLVIQGGDSGILTGR